MVSSNQETLNQVRKLARSAENFERLYELTEGLYTDTDSEEARLRISSILDEGRAYRSHKTQQNFGAFYRAIVGFLLGQQSEETVS